MPPGGSSDAWGCAQQGAGHHSDVGVLSTLQSQAQPAPRSSSKPCSVDLPRASNPNPGRHPQHHSSTAPVAARHAACAASSAASAAAPRTASGTALDGTSGGWDVDTIDNSLLLSIDLGLASGRMSAVEATELLASYGCDVQELLAAEMAAAAAEEEQDEAEQLRKGKGEEVERQEEERPSKEQEEQEVRGERGGVLRVLGSRVLYKERNHTGLMGRCEGWAPMGPDGLPYIPLCALVRVAPYV